MSFDDDGTFLYVFLTLGPSLDERFLTAPFDDSKKFYLLIDTDNSVEELDEDSPFADSVPEYEVALRVYLFYEESWAASVAGASYSFYELLVHDHHVPSASPVETPESQKRRQSSRARNRLIAHGIAGVEMAVPLETMGVRKGQRVTAYLWDDARQRGDRRPIYDPFNYVTGGSDEAAGKP